MIGEGSASRPYRENPPEHLKEVHWSSGGTFIAGSTRYSDNHAAIRYVRLPGTDTWDNLGVGAFGSSGVVMGSSVGRDDDGSVFVLVGTADFGTDIYGVIMASLDGHAWHLAYTGRKSDATPIAQGSSVFGVVWDEDNKQFWAGAHESNNGTGPDDIYETDILLSSRAPLAPGDPPLGFLWSEYDRRDIPFAEWTAYGTGPGLLAAHCSNRVKDTYGHAVPDGLYGVSATTLIRPSVVQTIQYLTGTFRGLDFEPALVFVDVATGREGLFDLRDSGVTMPVACVARAGGILVLGGGYMAPEGEQARSLYSRDNLATLVPLVTPGESAAIWTMVGR